MLKLLSFLDSLILKLKLKIRNRLTKELPYFLFSDLTDTGHIETQIRHDNNSYSCKIFEGNRLKSIVTGRHNFTETYNAYFNKEGKRIYSLFVNDTRVILNHKHCLVAILLDNKDDVHITVQKQGNSSIIC